MHPTSLQNLLDLTVFGPHSRLIVEALLALAAALAAVAVRRRELVLGTRGFAMLALGLVMDEAAGYAETMPRFALGLKTAALILFFWGLIYFLVRGLQRLLMRGRTHASTIFNDLLIILLYVAVVLVALRAMLNVDLAALLATSAVLTVVLGLGLQETLGNIFSGLTLQLQKPFLPGDWVKFTHFLGRVQGIGWRSTRVLTRSNERLEIPNSMLAKDIVTNYSAAGTVADEIFIGLPYSEPPNRVREVVMRVMTGIPDALVQPGPEVFSWEFADSAIKYRIKYWLKDYTVQEHVRDRVVTALWYALRRNGIEIPFPIRTLYMHEVPRQSEVEALNQQRLMKDLRSVDFLSGLSDEELLQLVPKVRVHQFGHGEVLMREGEVGECFHVLRRGSVELLANSNNGGTIHLKDMAAPAFFGETSLVTGEPRNATIKAISDCEVLEISKDGFSELFRAHPETASEISSVIEARIEENKASLSRPVEESSQRPGESWLLSKMRVIFDLPRGQA